MTIAHHPDLSSLLVCAAGSQPEARAAVMASHLAVCPACRAEVSEMQQIGVALFDALEPAAVTSSAPVIALRAGEADAAAEVLERGRSVATDGGDVPGPLVDLVGANLDDVAWRWKGPGVWIYDIPLSAGAQGSLKLIKVAPGTALPEHGHGGQEITIVLRGTYADALGTYKAGDVSDLDAEVDHSPIACPKDGCICLTATDGSLRFKRLLPRLMQPLLGL